MLTTEQKRWAASGTRTKKACKEKAGLEGELGQKGKLAEALFEFSQQCADKRQQRRRDSYVMEMSLQSRLNKRLIAITQAETTRRGLNTPTCSPVEGTITDYKPQERIWLVNCEYKYHYSNTFGEWWVRASWLAGHDETGYWAIRVPGTLITVEEALNWLIPQAVLDAQAAGKQVIRQGDAYLVEKSRKPDHVRDLPYHHRWNPERRILSHHEHDDVHVPYPFRAYVQRSLVSTSSGAYSRHGD